jgi:hypothetical protein
MRRGWYMYHYGTRAAYNECNARLDPRIVTTTFTHFVLSDSIWNIYSTGATQILWNTAMRYTRTHTHTHTTILQHKLQPMRVKLCGVHIKNTNCFAFIVFMTRFYTHVFIAFANCVNIVLMCLITNAKQTRGWCGHRMSTKKCLSCSNIVVNKSCQQPNHSATIQMVTICMDKCGLL